MQYQLTSKRTLTKSGVGYTQTVLVNWMSGEATYATAKTKLDDCLSTVNGYLNSGLGFTVGSDEKVAISCANDNSTALASCNYAKVIVRAKKISGTGGEDEVQIVMPRERIYHTATDVNDAAWSYHTILPAITGLLVTNYVPTTVVIEITA